MRTTLTVALALAASTAMAAETTSPLALATVSLVLTIKDLDVTVKQIDGRVEDMIRVKEVAKVTTIELPADILFDFDKSDIRSEAMIALSAAAARIQASAKGTVSVNGHTDAKGTATRNQVLSLERAKSVSTWLVAKGGLAKVKFDLKGFGATKPAAPNAKPDGSDNPEGRQLNRRVEIIFSSK